jgi:L-rhamnose isomerase
VDSNIEKQYKIAQERYAAAGIDTDKALSVLKGVPISVNCWQGDDVSGFESNTAALEGGGIMVTGGYPGKPRNIGELMKDAQKAFSIIPGKKKLALHAMYGDFKGKFEGRDKIETKHFESWVDWAKANKVGLDFNPTLFSHPYVEDGYTLASTNEKIRKFWVKHLNKSREIGDFMGGRLKEVCSNNIWIPDGSKDTTVNRLKHREQLLKSLDEIFSKKYSDKNIQDSLEPKLFGIGVESYTAGSLEFYLGYAVKNSLQITLDTGHFHPTELVSDKITAVLPFVKGIQLHVTRSVRWDSDHIPILTEELIAIMQEIVRAKALNKVFIGTDYFDASINRIGAWVIGARSVIKALLLALLEPTDTIRKYEQEKNYFARLAMLEELKFMPYGDIWNYYCKTEEVVQDLQMIAEVMDYEKEVLSKR